VSQARLESNHAVACQAFICSADLTSYELFLIPLVDVGGGQIAKNMHVDCVTVFTKTRDFVPARYLCDEMIGARWIRKGSNGKLLANEEAF
jgi:hypothetical protein